MGRGSDVAKQWWPMGVLLVLGVVAALDMTGRLDPIVANLVARSPEFWSALAAWVAVLVGIATVVVAGRYAKHQVDEARRTREEQAQPNVVIYTETTPSHWQFLDVVLKNFGTTPAFNVTVEITPQLRQTPDYAGGETEAVPFPKLTRTLAPGQDLRTNWDFAVGREEYNTKLRAQLDKGELSDEQFREKELKSQHEAIVRYEDSRENKYETRSILDFDLLRDTMRVSTHTVHELTKETKKQVEQLAKITCILGGFGKEHEGVWVYPSSADDERQYKADYAEALNQRRQQSRERIFGRQPLNSVQSETPGEKQP